jgi:hypothetical protein
MLPHGCWRAPQGYDEVGPRLDQSLFGEREEHGCATRDSAINRDAMVFLTMNKEERSVVYRVRFVFGLFRLVCTYCS